MPAAPRPLSRPVLLPAALACAAALSLGAPCGQNQLPASGSQLFMSPQSNPVALSNDGSVVYVANTTAGTLSVIETAPPHDTLAEIAVGLDPVGVAVRPALDPEDPLEDEQVLVANHVSDSISVVSRQQLAVVQTIQELDGDGVTTTDEPVGLVFDGRDRAFATLDHPNQVIELRPDAGGAWQIAARTTITSNAPRALAMAGGRLVVAAFESGNQSEFPSCGASDPIDFDRGNPVDEGCLFPLNLLTLAQFAMSPNIGGEVIHDGDIPDRDLFVYDPSDLAAGPVETVTGVGTLLYGVAGSGSRVYVTHTEARNKLDGLEDLANRMFENRLAWLDCAPGCGGVTHVDLDANAAGAPVPTPYGVAASDDGQTLVVSVAGSDGVPGIPADPGTDIPGLVVLNATGTLLGHVRTGAIPQGLALASDAGGAARTAFVLNSVDATLSVVDVANPAAPAVTASVPVGADPTPPAVARGRIQFASARASTGGTFSCESCHPNGNIDQILWVINTLESPEDVPGCESATEHCPEPRSTMPVRGLRDTLPLHWVGNLSDPLPGVFLAEDDGAPDCDLAVDGEVGCIRHVVDASLAGVMCAQDSGTPCAAGPSGAPGPLDDAERDDMAAFLAAVAYPPSPRRRPDDALGASARTGLSEVHTDVGGAPQLLGVRTCADSAAGCHALPLGVATNSITVGRFDAPTLRGLWDRHVLFSNGFTGSEEFQASQGFDPGPTGMQEFGSLASTFPSLFTLAYGMPVDAIWAFVNEMSVGLPGLTGRQLALTPDNAGDPEVGAALAQVEAAALERRITAVARGGPGVEYRFKVSGLWVPAAGVALETAALRDLAVQSGVPLTVTAELPATLQAGGAARQPLLSPSPADAPDGAPNLPEMAAGATAAITLAQRYVEPDAAVLIDGAACGGCGLALAGDTLEITLDPTPATPGVYALQVLNPAGFASNELPICVGVDCRP